jgi:hypothetical protein
MNDDTIRRVIRASAVYDIIVTTGFAVPATAAAALSSLSALHHGLGLAGSVPLADDPFTMLFANLLGSIVTVWSVVRLIRPVPILGAADTVARLLFSTWFLWALAHGASPVLVGFLVVEIGWALLQGYAVWRPLRTDLRASAAAVR